VTPEQKAEQAKRMVESPIWTECWENVQKDLFEQFCANVDLETRQRISFAMDLTVIAGTSPITVICKAPCFLV